MITYVKSTEAKLFELAAADLGLARFETVDQYLNKLAELKAISPKYVRLPLYEDGHEDEEIFEINANERTIKVPASFNKNGVGVVSDELAETLWFKINRYFDIKDFGKAVESSSNVLDDGDLHILIQWEAPDGAQGASWAYAIDADTDPDFIYFGWALTAEHLMSKAGNIKFGIRILQYDSDGIAYSFATQAAQITVKAGLSFNLTDNGVKFEDVADKIANRLMGGQIAHCPVFAEDGNLPSYIFNLSLPENPQEGDVPQALLEVNASAPHDEEYDAMAYKWYHKGRNDDEFTQIEGEYTPALTITESGDYYVVVFGMREIVDNEEYIYDADLGTASLDKFKYHTSIASTKSVVCNIPAPIKLEIEEDIDDVLVLHADPVPVLVMLVKRQRVVNEAIDEELVVGDVTLTIEKTASAEKDLDLETAEFSPVGEPSEGSEGVAEAWIYNGNEYNNQEAAEAAYRSDNLVPDDMSIPSDAITHREAVPATAGTPGVSYIVEDNTITINMSKAAEGYYRIQVINSLNGNEEVTDSMVICRVVKPAAAPTVNAILLTEGGNVSDAAEGSVSRHNRIRADISVGGNLSDSLEIQWFKVKGDKDPEDEEGDILMDGHGAEFEPNDDGSYYFKAINKVEDTQAEAASSVIVFRA